MKVLFTLLLAASSLMIMGQSDTQPISNEGPKTSLEFNTKEFNFGTIYEGEKIQNVFVITNTGTEPLVIINAKGSCGCTVPRFPQEPIMPGESADMLVQFDSKNKGKVGGQVTSKRVSITANTDPMISYVTIKGKVDKKSESPASSNGDFDVAASDLNFFPNPAQDHVDIEIKNHDGLSAGLEMYDATGSLLVEGKIDAISTDPWRMQLADVPSGVYTMVVKLEGKNRIAKQLVIEK